MGTFVGKGSFRVYGLGFSQVGTFVGKFRINTVGMESGRKREGGRGREGEGGG